MGTRPRWKYTRSIPYYRNMVEKKRHKYYPASVACTSNRCRVVFMCVLSLPFPIPFIGSSLHLKKLYREFLTLVCKDGSSYDEDDIDIPPPHSTFLFMGLWELLLQLSHEKVSIRWSHTSMHGHTVVSIWWSWCRYTSTTLTVSCYGSVETPALNFPWTS